MKKLVTMAVLVAMTVGLCAMAETKDTKVYSNKYIDVTVKQPVYDASSTNLQDTEAVRKIQKTKEAVDATKSSVKELKTLWGIK